MSSPALLAIGDRAAGAQVLARGLRLGGQFGQVAGRGVRSAFLVAVRAARGVAGVFLGTGCVSVVVSPPCCPFVLPLPVSLPVSSESTVPPVMMPRS